MVLDGYGFGDGDGFSAYLALVSFPAAHALTFPNAELRRMAIESMGPDRFFTELKASVVHADIDGCGNPRRLLRVALDDAEAGYLQAVEVVCPTTGRVYHLGVQPDVVTCQAAVASTFGMTAAAYQLIRES